MGGLWGEDVEHCRPATGPALVDFEVVASDEDFFISVNGGLTPSECTAFAIGASGCMEFLMEGGYKLYSCPLPTNSLNVVTSREKVLFVLFENGEPCDAKELQRQVNEGETVCQ